MEIQHLIAKIHVEGALGFDPAQVVDVFHKWVAGQTMPGVILVDVAELLHVPKGPGVIAVGHEADYALDNTGGVWGVLYRQKVQRAGTNAERVAYVLREAAHAGALLEQAFPSGLKFSRTTFELIVNDRGIAPNITATYSALEPEFAATLKTLLGHGDFKFARHDREPRQRFGITVTSAKPFDLAPVTAH
jgi:hypothetical protein